MERSPMSCSSSSSENSNSQLNRRQFVSLTVATMAASAVCAACGLDAHAAEGGAAPGPAPSKVPNTPLNVGPKADFAKDGVYTKFAKPDGVLIVRNEGKIYACSSICT